MFDSTVYSPTHKVNINAVSGTLSKTCKDSFFKQCQLGSPLMQSLMSDNPQIEQRGKEVVILQAMIIPENRMMFELIYKSDFDKLGEEQNHEI